ncbi:MAG: response regulator [Cyclobacteriaceae bacterium]|nr:response regulator [Cyclobacteriaceae bacterium]
MDKVKILIVEDEMIIAAKISMQLTNLGYHVTGIVPRGDEVIAHVQENKPDILLLDINLKGSVDGIEIAAQLQKLTEIPIIYLTANADEATFNRAKETKPNAFISKPYKQLDLQRAIELTISRMGEKGEQLATETPEEPAFVLNDRIFVRHKEKMIKIMLSDIYYIEADRNYSHLFTKEQAYVLAITLKTIEEKLPSNIFLRVHRSFVINLTHVEEVTEGQVMIGRQAIPLGAGMREILLKNMRTL